MAIKRFKIDPNYLVDVPVKKDMLLRYIDENGEPAEIKGTSLSFKDHPDFTEFREKLGSEGFIKIERAWWNGDRVLIPFYLNEYLFKKGEKFPCAPAIGITLAVAKNKKKNEKAS